ncbi:MAG: hypothetical protein WDN08_13510 [Rhizomicrobium sp.]
MKRIIGTALAGVLAVNGGTGAWAAGCATAGDVAALKTAALQQELMVAAFSCRAVAQYNRFVLAHRPELMDADARLKAYFVHSGGGEAFYHTYKTELANRSSLRSLHESDFCAAADDEFAMTEDAALDAALDAHSWRAVLAAYPACTPDATQLAAAAPPRTGRDTRASEDRRAGGGDLSAPAPHRRIVTDSL